MFNNIYARYIAERKLSTVLTSVGLFLFSIMYSGIYETMKGTISDFAKNAPNGIEAIIGNLSAAASPNGWLNVELFSLFVPIVFASIGIMFGSGAIGKEEESGTLELLLASPISRRRIILEKAFGFSIQTAIISVATWLGVATGSIIFTFSVNLSNVFLAISSGWLVSLVFGYFTLAVQNISKKRLVGMGAGIGLLVIGYFADILSNLLDSLSFFKYISPFHYYNSENTLMGNFSILYFSILIICALLALVISSIAFEKRDTGVLLF